jgi:uncharacterized membrane protein
MENRKGTHRFWEIDTARGIAILSMIILHGLIDLYLLRKTSIRLNLHLWYSIQKVTITTFLLLAGLSLALKSCRLRETEDKRALWRSNVRRGLQLLAWGMSITFVTSIFLPKGYVVFGVLHCIGISTILSTPFLNRRRVNLFAGITILLGGFVIKRIHPDWPWLIWLGLTPPDFFSVDYVPMIPWFGLILLGLYCGSRLYPYGRRLIRLPDLDNKPLIRELSFLGRNSLITYLIHQPVILLIYKLFRLI